MSTWLKISKKKSILNKKIHDSKYRIVEELRAETSEKHTTIFFLLTTLEKTLNKMHLQS